MELRIIRVTVRGQFDALGPARRDALSAVAEDHDIFKSAFTTEGFFVYDPALVSFNIRYEIRERGPDAVELAAETALAKARAFLDGEGIGYKRLRAIPTEMAAMWR